MLCAMQQKSDQFLIIAAFAAIYFIWGSTYLANWYAIQDIPPFLMSGSRFLLAGILLYLVAAAFGAAKPTLRNLGHSFITGTLFLAIGTGGVVWAEQYIDSSMAALLIGAEPLVIVLLMWRLKAKRPSWNSGLGIILGVVGMYFLVGQPVFLGNKGSVMGLISIGISMLSWGFVAVKLNDFDLPKSRLQSSALQMIGGGLCLFLFASVSGEFADFQWTNLTSRGVYAWFYLIVFGSIITFSAFNYLLTKVSPEKVATSNYVNPIVALLLGWGINHEEITTQSFIAAGVLIFSVFLINSKLKKGSIAFKPFRLSR